MNPDDLNKKTEDEEVKLHSEVTSPRIKRQRRVVISAVILLLVSAGIVVYALLNRPSQDNGAITQRQSVKDDGNKIVTQEEEDITSVVEKVSPSVVSITTKSQSESPYFGVNEQEGAGTGIIVGKDGYVLTNKHVVAETSTVSVILSDGTTYDQVKVLGTDPLNDVAFLKIDGVNNLPAADLGDSSSIRVGQKVVAIGNSLGQYQNTVTSGIISGTGRPISAQSGNSVATLTDLIQTDAAINPGNSGGPLLNIRGQVIGINTAVAEGAQGVGFSIPINSTKGMLKGVLAGGKVQRAYVGVNFIAITPEAAKRYGLSVKKGAYIFSGNNQTAVIKGGPGEEAGLKDKDVITKVNGIEVGDRGGMASLVGEYAPGDTIWLTLLRNGQEMTVALTLEAYQV